MKSFFTIEIIFKKHLCELNPPGHQMLAAPGPGKVLEPGEEALEEQDLPLVQPHLLRHDVPDKFNLIAFYLLSFCYFVLFYFIFYVI